MHLGRTSIFLVLAAFLLAACVAAKSTTATPHASPKAPDGASTIAREPLETPIPSLATPTPSPSKTPTETPTTPPGAVTWAGTPPILLPEHRIEYGPNQALIAYVTGFRPNEALAVNLIHATQGLLAAMPDQADESGSTLFLYATRGNEGENGAIPAGEYRLEFQGALTARPLVYTFALDYRLSPTPTPDECGVYPVAPVVGQIIVAWCGGFASGDTPTQKVLLNGEVVSQSDLGVESAVGMDGLSFGAYTPQQVGRLEFHFGDRVVAVTVREKP